MRHLLAQLPVAARRLVRAPGFALLSILTLAVGIGAVTAVWSAVDTILLRPLPFAQADRLVALGHTAPGLKLDRLPQAPATYQLYRRAARTLAEVAVYQEPKVNLTGGEAPERLPAAAVSASLFRLLEVPPRLGRAFTAAEERPGGPAVVVLSDRLWHRRFGGDPAVVGKTVRIDGTVGTIVGVMPPGFAFPEPETELWLPLGLDPASTDLGGFAMTGVGRLAPGATAVSAERELNRLVANLPQAFPGNPAATVLAGAGFAARVQPLADEVVGDLGPTLWILLGAVGVILLIAAANVANLLLVRGEERRRETVIEIALGAPRGRLTAAVLAESLLLGMAAGALGVLLAGVGIRLLVRHPPLPLPRLAEVGLDGRVLAMTAAVALLTSLLFGLLPALRAAAATDLATELKGGRTATAGRSRRHSRRFLVGLQVALALVLLNGSGLMLRSFLRLSRFDPGFSAARVLTFNLALPAADYPDDQAASRFFATLAERAAALPGVAAAGAVTELPLAGRASAGGVIFEDFPVPPGAPPPVVGYEFVAGDSFEALGLARKAGRWLDRADAEHRTGAVVVGEQLARRYGSPERALGKRLRGSGGEGGADRWYTIVGVAGDIVMQGLTEPPGEMIYYPTLGRTAGEWTSRQMSVVLKTRGAPEALAAPVRRLVRGLDPNLPVASLQPMAEYLARARARHAFTAMMFLIASAVALLLGGVGLYGYVSYRVSQRTPEIGLRLALGAGRADIRRLVLGEILTLAAAGLAAGLLASLALTRTLGALLFGVSPLDPVTFAIVPLLLLAAMLAASHLPVRRAVRIDPLVAMVEGAHRSGRGPGSAEKAASGLAQSV